MPVDVEQVIRAYRTFDPVGWVGLYRLFPTWLGLALMLLGVALLLFGGGRLFRVVAGPMGALVGWLWAPVIAENLQLADMEAALSTGAALGLGVLGFVFPPAGLFFILGTPAGLAGGKVVGPNEWLLGFAPAFILAGFAGALMNRILAAVSSSVLGGWLFVMGVLAAFHQVPALGQAAMGAPVAVMALAGLIAATGSVYQLFIRPTPERREELQVEKARKKKRDAEKKALEKRWANYTDRPKKDR